MRMLRGCWERCYRAKVTHEGSIWSTTSTTSPYSLPLYPSFLQHHPCYLFLYFSCICICLYLYLYFKVFFGALPARLPLIPFLYIHPSFNTTAELLFVSVFVFVFIFICICISTRFVLFLEAYQPKFPLFASSISFSFAFHFEDSCIPDSRDRTMTMIQKQRRTVFFIGRWVLSELGLAPLLSAKFLSHH